VTGRRSLALVPVALLLLALLASVGSVLAQGVLVYEENNSIERDKGLTITYKLANKASLYEAVSRFNEINLMQISEP